MADTQPYGDVTYADPGYQADKVKRYPLDSKEHVKAAWSYINMPKNASKYSADQLSSIKGKIKSAAGKYGITISDDSKNNEEPEGEIRAYPTDNLIRMAVEPPGIKNGRTLFGTVIPYDKPAEIRGWEGHFIERIKPGAAKKMTQEGNPKVLFNHGMDPRIGEWPIGKPTMVEDRSDGVYAEVPVADTSYGDDLLALVDAGAIDGWSWRFSVPKGKETWSRPSSRDQLPSRDVHEMRVPEFGPVTFQAYEATTMGVRSMRELSIWRELSHEQRAQMEQVFALGADLGTSDLTLGQDAPGNEEAAAYLEEPDNFELTDDGRLVERNHSAKSHYRSRKAWMITHADSLQELHA
jgi:HK97 family phage prohead protease